MAFAVEMVGREQVTNAVALNSITFDVARTVGPAVAVLLIVAVAPAGHAAVPGGNPSGAGHGLDRRDGQRARPARRRGIVSVLATLGCAALLVRRAGGSFPPARDHDETGHGIDEQVRAG